MRARTALALALAALALAAAASPALGAEQWHSQQPDGPGGFPALLGEVGDLECWNGEANRCLLIAAGNGGIAAGVFAYDGSRWYRYSTVCGGSQGRIAWAGPDEFWTISDQQVGQATNTPPPSRVSLCHFKDGQVVASYGEPVGVPNSYRPMSAAACAGPSDCWFGGERLPATAENRGAFHLHWNGASVAAIPSQTVFSELSDPGRAVSGLAYHEGSFYESVNVEQDDVPNAEEEAAEEAGLGPSFLHRLEPGAATPFRPLFGAAPFDYGEASAEAAELQGFRLSGGDGEPLWAIAGAQGPSAGITALRLEPDGPVQLSLEGPGSILEAGVAVNGVGAEPGRDDAWVSFREGVDSGVGSPARLTRVHGDGTVDGETMLPAAGEELDGEAIGRKGLAGPVECAAAEQCWMATSKGWLFHLGPDPQPNSDPALHVLISFRPPDNSLPSLPPIELPEDDSGANGGRGTSDQEELPSQFEALPHRTPALVGKIKQRLVDGTVLQMSFTLRAKARVRLVASRKGRVVARTQRLTLDRGRHSLRLRLDPKRWPTKLDLQAHALGKGPK
jgi:hypothetical protein